MEWNKNSCKTILYWWNAKFMDLVMLFVAFLPKKQQKRRNLILFGVKNG